jgi:hypothetical protein
MPASISLYVGSESRNFFLGGDIDYICTICSLRAGSDGLIMMDSSY